MRHQCATPDAPWGWLARICQREAARLAARRRDVPLADHDAPEQPQLDHDPVEQLAVRTAVADLEALDRAMLRLRYRDDQTCARIGELLGLPEGTVKVRLHRARNRLRDVLAP
jgi:RNA polymerase sigma-70 factor, ECF subfamily